MLGLAGGTLYWLHGPYLKGEVARQVAEALQKQPLAVEAGKSGAELKAGPPQALGSRFQLVADGKQVFLADLQHGRVWRYFKHTKEGGYAKEEEGFLPMALFFAGKKYYTVGEIEGSAKGFETPSAAKPGGRSAP
ncbi:MAG: hypothetical protein FJ128_13580 [Deltaproteobacteria bacterium]|nr:hypothetical protein [Deltaproteobacteria bacterium]